MYKGFRLLIIILPVLWSDLLSQSISHQVLVPAAGLKTDGNIAVSQTIGETMVKITNNSYYILTQGFQQPSIHEMPDFIIPDIVRAFPNPVTDFITIEMSGRKARNYSIEFLDLTGRVVISARKTFGPNYWYREQYNVSGLMGGLYLIRFKSDDGLYYRILKMQKI
ncbi:MAG TPA: T9SS type A sorting domain-containing protein [Bacteroidales bacterium]|nr:T9SS type A sorting domain-containing protein [Bacteroidales bacterium]HPF02089.1 T9SS type A sorting domain-containing protein [Bacteroidales bacterium]HPJ59124.1 T9SS type A sorting domain-containing protein [Bacteroidales bacterium]HPR11424.1 T9SS type A sorting domain-containing protein [Bacteroidales bacterium]HRW85261.1 T9SS type A sorting domain-containing protein [Bacteroidales bacterium]